MLGIYRIESEAGSGGMGVVYRATDTTLKRPVAIKVLTGAAATDPDRRRRFVQEAQAASALNHSDIVTIYQIGSDGGTDYIAMELVPGRSLAETIGGRPMKPADVVKYAARIAGALAAAHRAGIVHRDLKPANVMITPEGGVKLLDFGVAKLTEPTAVSDTTAILAAPTATGMIVGTLAYMSPEQREGAPVDARSDIYSFGLVLVEMITGRRPAGAFDPAALSSAPRDLRRIAQRCLQLEPAARFQVMEDVRHALDDADVSIEPGAGRATRSRWPMAAAAIGALALAGIAGVAAWRLRPPPAAARMTVLSRLTNDSGLTTDPALSRDGRLVAFASDRAGGGNLDIWIRQVATGDFVRLTNDPADDSEPSFSPDGGAVAFRSDRDGGGVYVVPALGGDARRIADQGRRPRWSPDNSQIAYWTGINMSFLISRVDAPRIFVVPAGGGEPRRLFADFAVAFDPIWSADGRRLLFLGQRTPKDPTDWWTANADGSSPRLTGAAAALAAQQVAPAGQELYVPDAWMPDGRVLFGGQHGDAVNVFALSIDAAGRPAGIAERITAGTGIESRATVDAAGTVAFAAIASNVDLWSLPLDHASGLAAGAAARLTEDPASDLVPWLSPDGVRLVYASDRSGSFDLWVREMATGKESMVAPRIPFPAIPTFTKDGQRVTYATVAHGRWVSVPAGGGTTKSIAPQLVCEGCQTFWDLSASGWALFGSDEDTRIAVRQVSSGTTVELMHPSDTIVGRFRISPDDRWMAFNRRRGGAFRIFIAPFQTTGPIAEDLWIPVTSEDTVSNASTWSADGNTLYYLSNRDGGFCVWGQRLDPATKHPVGDPFGVWHFHEARRAMWRIPMGLRGLTASRDRMVVSLAEATGNIWLAK